jgi:hypothetical protein
MHNLFVYDFSPITRCWAAQHDIYMGGPSVPFFVSMVVVVVVNVYVGQCGLCSHCSVHSSHRGVIQWRHSVCAITARPYIYLTVFFCDGPDTGSST